MKQLAFYFDSRNCSGCKTCQMACKDKNNLAMGTLWRRVYEVSGGEWEQKKNTWVPNIYAYNVSLACNHCEDPICLKNCPSGAIKKREDGIVWIDQDNCLGCNYCEWVCPYGAPQYNEEKGVMGKCNLCSDYVDEGKNPSCVDACPTRSLDFGTFDELVEKYGEKEHVYPLPSPEITRPSIIVNPHKDAHMATNMNPEVVNMEEIKHA